MDNLKPGRREPVGTDAVENIDTHNKGRFITRGSEIRDAYVEFWTSQDLIEQHKDGLEALIDEEFRVLLHEESDHESYMLDFQDRLDDKIHAYFEEQMKNKTDPALTRDKIQELLDSEEIKDADEDVYDLLKDRVIEISKFSDDNYVPEQIRSLLDTADEKYSGLIHKLNNDLSKLFHDPSDPMKKQITTSIYVLLYDVVDKLNSKESDADNLAFLISSTMKELIEREVIDPETGKKTSEYIEGIEPFIAGEIKDIFAEIIVAAGDVSEMPQH